MSSSASRSEEGVEMSSVVQFFVCLFVGMVCFLVKITAEEVLNPENNACFYFQSVSTLLLFHPFHSNHNVLFINAFWRTKSVPYSLIG